MKKSLLLTFVLFFAIPLVSNAQLRKSSETEKVKSFTNGTVTLYKATVDDMELYSVSLRNNSKYCSNVVLWLGTKQEMIQNLNDFSEALQNGKKGDLFEYSSYGFDYTLSFGTNLGMRCFQVYEPHSTSQDFGRFFKSTIDDMIEYFNKIDN